VTLALAQHPLSFQHYPVKRIEAWWPGFPLHSGGIHYFCATAERLPL
jgi:hypothetical protein